MRRRKRAIWTERLLLALICVSLLATLNLIVAMHRRVARRGAAAAVSALPDNARPSIEAPAPAIEAAATAAEPVHADAEPTAPPPAPEDPTKKILASLASATAVEIAASRQADQRADALERARAAATAESRNWKRRDMLIRQQIEGLTRRAEVIETETKALEAERDVLAHERDVLKAAVSKASHRSGYAVLPYKGANGTWRRPIVVECLAGGVKLQPQGMSFTTMDLSPFLHPRSSPFVRAVAAELLHIQSADTPDGAPAVPYLVFLVRPNGIRPYYEARSRLEPLGIAFGYELIDQDLVVDIPNFDNLTTWDGSVPLELPLEAAPDARSTLAMLAAARQSRGSPGSATWPRTNAFAGASASAAATGSHRADERGGGNAANENPGSPDDFVWPSRPRPATDPARPGTEPGRSPSGPESFGSGMLGGGRGGSSTRAPAAGGGAFVGNGMGPGTAGAFGRSDGEDDSSGRTGSPRGGLGSNPGAQKGGNGNGGGSAARNSGQGSTGSTTDTPSGDVIGTLPDLEPADDPVSSIPPYPRGGSSMGLSRGNRPGQSAQQVGAAGGLAGLASAATSGRAPSGVGLSQNSAAPGSAESAGAIGAGGGDERPSSTTGTGGPGTVAASNGRAADQPTAGGSAAPGLNAPPAPSAASSLASPAPSAAGSVSSIGASSTMAPAPPPASSGPSFAASPSTSDTTLAGSSAVAPSAAPESAASLNANLMSSSLSALASAANGSSPSSAASTTTLSSSNFSMTSSPAGGMPLGSTASSPTSSSSSASFSLGQAASSSSDTSAPVTPPPPPKPALTMGAIDVPFEIVVVCRPGDLLIHPGGYRVTTRAMAEQGGGANSLIAREIRALVRQRAQVDPMIRPKPAIKFLVEANGSETFWTARRQLLFSLSDWPMSVQVADSQGVHVFNKETW